MNAPCCWTVHSTPIMDYAHSSWRRWVSDTPQTAYSGTEARPTKNTTVQTGKAVMWRKSLLLTNDFDKARAEAHVLAQLRETQAGPLLVADVPVRFRTIV